MGYWLYQNGTSQTTFAYDGRKQVKRTVYSADHWLTGFAPLMELHFNRSLQESDPVQSGNIIIQSFEQFSLTNLVLGGFMTFGNGGSVTVAWSAPIIGRDDKQFAQELRIALDWEL